MTIIAVTRISGYRLRNNVDGIWLVFWQHMEGCIAINMASITVFRTVLVAAGSKRSQKNRRRPLYSIRLRLMMKTKSNKSNKTDNTLNHEDLPTIPGATLKGMRTFIRQNNRSAGQTTLVLSEYNSLNDDDHAERNASQGIHVKRKWSIQSHRVCIQRESVPHYDNLNDESLMYTYG